MLSSMDWTSKGPMKRSPDLQHCIYYGYFNPPTPTLTPEIVLLMCVAKSCIFHRMKNADFVRLLLCSIVGLMSGYLPGTASLVEEIDS